MIQGYFADQADPAAARQFAEGIHPLGRLGKPRDIADAFVYLASDEASWVTGHGARRRRRPDERDLGRLMPELWTPAMAGPLEELVKRVHRRIDGFREEHGLDEVACHDRARSTALVYRLASLAPSPASASSRLCPHCDEGEPSGADRPARDRSA